MYSLITCFLALFAGCVTARAQPVSSLSPLATRQTNSSTADCNTLCTNYQALHAKCKAPHCGCNVPFLQAQGNCLLCQTSTPQDASAVQFLLDTEMNQCHSEGINVDFQLDLPPEAAAIVQNFHRDSASLRRSQTAFLALQVSGGHVGMAIILAFAVFGGRVRRDPTFLNFCITWIFSSVVFSFMLYRGTEGNTIANSLGKVIPTQCLAQAAFTEGAQVMTACSTLVLVIQLWLGLGVTIHGDPAHGPKRGWWVTCVLIIAPYILFIAFALPSVFLGRGNTIVRGTTLERAIPTNFYCAVVEVNSFLKAVYSVTLGLLVITMVFDVLIVSVLYKHWRYFRNVEANSVVSLSCLLRVMAFSLYRVVVAIAYVAVIATPPAVNSLGQGDSLAIIFSVPIWADLLQAAIPLVGFLVLGINRETANCLMFWRRLRAGSTSKLQLTNIKNIDADNDAGHEKAILVADAKFVSFPV